jgi:TM2 domain-containing membrane protein YozV
MQNTKSQQFNKKPNIENKKVLAALMAILLGGLGIHKFVLGYATEGLIMLLVSSLGIVFSCFVVPLLGTVAIGIIGFAEGIIYLTKTDEEFYQMYQVGRKGWF